MSPGLFEKPHVTRWPPGDLIQGRSGREPILVRSRELRFHNRFSVPRTGNVVDRNRKEVPRAWGQAREEAWGVTV